jgi:hypothetical protein
LQADNSEKIRAGHVYQNVQSLENKISQLAFLMGVTFVEHHSASPENIYPRDVYYQGLTIYKKIGRIRYEYTRLEADKIENANEEYESKHVLTLVKKTHLFMDEVLNHIYVNYTINIDGDDDSISNQSKVDLNKTPKDVFVKLVTINRKLNQLMDFKFTPADTFEQATLAISYASAILQTISKEQTIYDPSSLEIGKTPLDVYNKLSDVHHKLYECLKSVNIPTAQISENTPASTNIQPSDVYDLTNLVLSNLAYLHGKLEQQVRVRPTYYPGKTLPSIVLQRVSILEKQVNAIHKLRYRLRMK